MPNIGFATLSVIPSFDGISVRARAGLGVITKIGKEVGEDAGKQFSKGFENRVDPKLKSIGDQAGRDFVKGVESAPAPDLVRQGREAGKGFTDGVKGAPPPDLAAHGAKAGNSLVSGMKTAVAAGALVVGAVFAQAFLGQLDKEVATDKLTAQLGGSEWAEGMGEVAGELYLQGFGGAVSDTANAVKRIVQAGLLPEDATNDQFEALGAQALTFADILDQDVGRSITAASVLIRNGLAANAGEAFDILTRGIQQGADQGDDLLDTFIEYPTVLRDLGLSGKTAMGLLVQGLKAGARNSDFAADALKEFAIRGQDASALSAEGFKLIGLNAKQMTRDIAAGGAPAAAALDKVLDALRNTEDPVKRNAAAVALFGTKAEDLGDALFALDPTTAADGLGRVAGSTDALGTAYDNAKSKVEVFKREAMDKLMTFIAEEVIPRLESFGGFVDRNSEAFTAAGIAVGIFAVGLGLLTVAAALAASPILLVFLAVAALGGILYYAYENWGWFRTGVDSAIEGMQDFYGWILDVIEKLGDLNAALAKPFTFIVDAVGSDGNKNPNSRGNQIARELDAKNSAFRAGGGSTPFFERRAKGGRALAGHGYWVGEEGPEPFVPDVNGTIIPNHQINTPGGAWADRSTSVGPFSITVHADKDTDGFKVGRQVKDYLTKELRTDPAFRQAVGAA